MFNECGGGAVRHVAPHAGAWIEIYLQSPAPALVSVAPHAGAWIEILIMN